jgi:hypothetical protein
MRKNLSGRNRARGVAREWQRVVESMVESWCILLLEPAFPKRQALLREAGEILHCKGVPCQP